MTENLPSSQTHHKDTSDLKDDSPVHATARKLTAVLCASPGVSGFEDPVAQTLEQLLKTRCDEVRQTVSNSVIGVRTGSVPNAPVVLLEAHLDEIGLIVTSVQDSGFLRMAPIGGVDARALLAAELIVHGNGNYPGVVASIPPHLLEGHSAKQMPEIGNLLLDVGMDGATATRLIPVGSAISFSPSPRDQLQGRFSCKALDNRAGCAVLLLVLDLLSSASLPFDLAVLFSAQEEKGQVGAAQGAAEIDPALAIAVDVTFAHTPDSDEHATGPLGGGPLIGFSPTLDRRLSEKLAALCQERGIPYKREVMTGETGTDAGMLQISGMGTVTGLVSIPLRYMHTPVETVSIDDIVHAAELIASFVQAICLTQDSALPAETADKTFAGKGKPCLNW